MLEGLRSGVLYTALGKYSNVVIQLAVNMVLSRLLSPRDYGVVAVAQVFLLFFTTIVDAGLGPAVIQNRSLSERDHRVLFSYSIVFSCILSILFAATGPLIAHFYGNPVYLPLALAMSSTLLLQGFNMIPNALMNKAKRFREVNLRLVASNLCGGVAGIWTALAGWGAYALVMSFTVPALVAFVLNMLLLRVWPARSLERASLSKVWKFAKSQFGFNFINYFSRNIDKILVGKFMGPAAVGNYSKSYQLLMLPNQVLLEVINPVLLPVLADHQDDVRTVREVYYKLVRFLLLIGFPLSVFLFFQAANVIRVMYGSQWGAAVLPFSILALTVWVQMSLSSTGSIFQVLGQTGYLFWNGCITALLLVSSIVIGCLLGSLTTLAISLSVGFVLNFVVIFFLMTRKLFASSFLDFLRRVCLVPLGGGVLVGAVLLALKLALPELGTLLSLVVSGVSSLLIFAIYTKMTGQMGTLRALLFRRSPAHVQLSGEEGKTQGKEQD
ncbi:lipopolysaccharide biosynthesis protein [Bombiscardovia apis]|uniref:Lipopolysaccharide biosynthesis protein n=1 Tax=Bombiscardovia apis TaxID=2932182 RepID=A0ABM8BBJ8_9BIFI|nr:lipopolysaccharide biosynthesis protein [Bombiscardovia apis]BDR54292.1 lipopolysaccharide biosynthesis protein [Bombiscardovia apis]